MRETGNIRKVEQTGADMIGFIFYPRSSRYVEEVPDYLPQHTKRVGVFVNEKIEAVQTTVTRFGLHCVQLHGEELPEFCWLLRQSNIGIIKTFPISHEKDLQAVSIYKGVCDYYLFDTKCDERGGSGKSFDWSILNLYEGQTPFLLSGGISMESIEALKEFKHPRLAGIDINSRFEVSPGMKDVKKIKNFLTKLSTQ
ncbi:N-(5'-phosphoribosyl)anthranilate isomerase [termite gut metagenome]|uniref:phosphoribosylanthranilate isomerase n=1 Tax=termite gut metagenome TaxID=433724 RepID=A0A5J4Q8H2_9ZZZZ